MTNLVNLTGKYILIFSTFFVDYHALV